MNTETAVSTDLMIRNPIKAAVRLSRRASVQEIENISSEHESAVGVLSRIDQLQSSLFPVERGLLLSPVQGFWDLDCQRALETISSQ